MQGSSAIEVARELITARRFGDALAVLSPFLRGGRVEARGLSLAVGVLLETGQVEPAAYQAERLVGAFPGVGLHHAVLGDCRRRQGRLAEASASYERGLSLDGSLVGARLGLARCCRAMGKHAESLAHAERAAREHAGVFEATALAATIRHDLGDAQGAVSLLREAARQWPTDERVWRLMAFVGNSCASVSAEELAAWHSTASSLALHAAPVVAGVRGERDAERREGRPLRIVLLSPDLREHPVSRFVLAFVRAADRTRAEFVGYHLASEEDERTREVAGLCVGWRNVAGMPDGPLAAAIAAEGADVLVDLAGFTNGGRPRVVAARPARCVVSWIGYAHGLGMPGVVRLSDERVDRGSAEIAHVPGCFLADEPPREARERASRRSAADRAVTLGCFAGMSRLTEETLEAWAGAMRACPGTRLVLKNEALGDGVIRDRVVEALAGRGVERGRVEGRGRSATKAEHFAAFEDIDLALDTLPYNGTTTTCDALAMGVPVVTAVGETPAGRVGASLLAAAGLHDAVAASVGSFAEVVARWVSGGRFGDAARAERREMVGRSRLHDTGEHARAVLGVLDGLVRG